MLQMPPMGWAAGVLGRLDPTPESLEMFLAAGADAVEIHVSREQLLLGNWTYSLADVLARFRWVSLHAPRMRADDRSALIEKIRRAADVLPIQRVTLHPEADTDFVALEADGDLFAIENMDRRKTVGTSLHLFDALARSTSLPFVLDVQHAWEHDPLLGLADELLHVMGPRLSHLHLSGSDAERIHAPLTEAGNAVAILDFYARSECLAPVILEGEYHRTDRPIDRLRDELDLVREMVRTRVEITGPRG